MVNFTKPIAALVKKFFPLDKNYLLEQAQFHCRAALLHALLQRTKSHYEFNNNPLGLEDSFTAKIRTYTLDFANHSEAAIRVSAFYEKLAAIYRFKHGDNQLEFLWDGNDHFQYYVNAWRATFLEWTENFCAHDLFIQAILDLTVFLPAKGNAQMIETRMNHFIEKHLEVKILNKASGCRLQAFG